MSDMFSTVFINGCPGISFECQLPEFRDDLLAILQKLVSFDEMTVFNVVYEEALVFPEFIRYDRILQWVGSTGLFSFDIVARSKAIGY